MLKSLMIITPVKIITCCIVFFIFILLKTITEMLIFIKFKKKISWV